MPQVRNRVLTYSVTSKLGPTAKARFLPVGKTPFYDAVIYSLVSDAVFLPLTERLGLWSGLSAGLSAQAGFEAKLQAVGASPAHKLQGARIRFIKDMTSSWSLSRRDVVNTTVTHGYAKVMLVAEGQWQLNDGRVVGPGALVAVGGPVLWPAPASVICTHGKGPHLLLTLNLRHIHVQKGVSPVTTSTGQVVMVNNFAHAAAGLDLGRMRPIAGSTKLPSDDKGPILPPQIRPQRRYVLPYIKGNRKEKELYEPLCQASFPTTISRQ